DGSREARVIGSIVDYRYAPDDAEAVIELLAAPSTRIISLTITEGGYNIDNLGGIAGSAGGGGIAGSAGGGGIAGSAGGGGIAGSAGGGGIAAGGGGVNVFGLVGDALARRRDRGIASLTIVSCDNIEGNGAVARHAFTTYAEREHPGLG